MARSGGYYELHHGVATTCVSGRAAAPPELAGLRAVSLTAPADTLSACYRWWAVTLSLDDADRIAGVALCLGVREARRMSRVVFMCGPSGSGKKRYAQRLEDQGMVRLSFASELWRRGVVDVPPPADIRAEIEAALRQRLLGLVAAASDVVLDFSFWSRRMREDYRRLLEPSGVVPETVYLATDRTTVLNRVRARAGSHSDDSVLSEELAAEYFDHVEPPTAGEGPLLVIDGGPATAGG